MTVQEAIKYFETFYMIVDSEGGREACEMAIDTFNEIQKYHEIGTLEECWKAREKQNVKKPILINYQKYNDKILNAEFLEYAYFCPNCKAVLRSGSYCVRCGQKLDWK